MSITTSATRETLQRNARVLAALQLPELQGKIGKVIEAAEIAEYLEAIEDVLELLGDQFELNWRRHRKGEITQANYEMMKRLLTVVYDIIQTEWCYWSGSSRRYQPLAFLEARQWRKPERPATATLN